MIKYQNIKNILVFDFDGVLADSTHRYRTVINEQGIEKIDLTFWRENSTPEQIAKDKPIYEQVLIYQAACRCPDTLVIIATSRIFCDSSADWVLNNLGYMPDFIQSRRGEHDTRKGADLKGGFIAGLRATFQTLAAARVVFFDDNLEYLRGFSQHVPDAELRHIPSKQGH